jgi:hypothetical protein
MDRQHHRIRLLVLFEFEDALLNVPHKLFRVDGPGG